MNSNGSLESLQRVSQGELLFTLEITERNIFFSLVSSVSSYWVPGLICGNQNEQFIVFKRHKVDFK